MNRLIFIIALISLINQFSCVNSQKNGRPGVGKIIRSSKGEPVIPRGANRIFIKNFINTSGRIGIENRLMTSIENLISMDGRLAVVTSPSDTDLVLSGRIISFVIQNVEYNELGLAVRKRMRIIAAVKLLDSTGSRTIFRESPVQSFREYSDIIPPIEMEFQVLNSVIDNLAERVFSKTLTGWYTDKMTNIEKGKR